MNHQSFQQAAVLVGSQTSQALRNAIRRGVCATHAQGVVTGSYGEITAVSKRSFTVKIVGEALQQSFLALQLCLLEKIDEE